MKACLGGVVAVLAAVGAMGCSSTPSPTADGNVQMRLFASADPATQKYCKIVHSMQMAKNNQVPNHELNSPGGRYADGDSGYKVSCKVHGSNDFTINGRMVGPSSQFSFNGTVTKGGTGQGNVSEYDAASTTSVTNPTDQPCTFNVSPDPLQVASGHIWATFSCPTVLDDSNPTATTCGASGEFVFENCTE